jgi:CheY-like chemotaxis protein
MARVLVVENYPAMCSAIRDVLEETQKFRVTTAPSARAAFTLLELERPDLAIIDVILPGRPKGIELASEVVASDIPVLLMTGEPGMQARLEGLQLPHLGKPFRRDDLVREVSRALADPLHALADARQKLRELCAELSIERSNLRASRERARQLVEEGRDGHARARELFKRSDELKRTAKELLERASRPKLRD